MRIAVLGAGGGLGRNVVGAARAAKHDVVALVRDPKRAEALGLGQVGEVRALDPLVLGIMDSHELERSW